MSDLAFYSARLTLTPHLAAAGEHVGGVVTIVYRWYMCNQLAGSSASAAGSGAESAPGFELTRRGSWISV